MYNVNTIEVNERFADALVAEEPAMCFRTLRLLDTRELMNLGARMEMLVQFKTCLHGEVSLISTMCLAQAMQCEPSMWEAVLIVMIAKGDVHLNPDRLTLSWNRHRISVEGVELVAKEMRSHGCEVPANFTAANFIRRYEQKETEMIVEFRRNFNEDYGFFLKHGQQEDKDAFYNAT